MKNIITKFFIVICVVFLSSGMVYAKKWYEFWKNEKNTQAILEVQKAEKEARIKSTWKDEYLYNTKYYMRYDVLYDKETVYLIVEGLKEQSSVVRWYCAYKISDYLNFVDKNYLKARLSAMMEDKVVEVRDAAAFTLSLIDKKYDKEWFIKSPDGKKIAFTKYNGVRYNNSGIWMINNGNVEALVKGIEPGDTGELTWSPDSEKIAYTVSGRYWQYVQIINIFTEKKHKVDFREGGVYGQDFTSSPDGQLASSLDIVEWKIDSKQILLKYDYYGKIHSTGLMIYDMEKQDVVKIIFKDAQTELGSFDWKKYK